MKVYGTGIYENDRADLVGLAYLHFSISQIEDVIEWMKGTDEPAQQLLGYLENEKVKEDLKKRPHIADVIVR